MFRANHLYFYAMSFIASLLCCNHFWIAEKFAKVLAFSLFSSSLRSSISSVWLLAMSNNNLFLEIYLIISLRNRQLGIAHVGRARLPQPASLQTPRETQ